MSFHSDDHASICKEYTEENQYDIICLVGDVIDSTNMLLNNSIVYKIILAR